MSDCEFARFVLVVICVLCAVGLMAAGKDGWG